MELYFPLVSFTPGEVRRSQCLVTDRWAGLVAHARRHRERAVELPKYLNDGYSVQLGYFGTMRISLSSEGAVTAKKFKTETIKPKIIFTPGTELKAEMEKISYRVE